MSQIGTATAIFTPEKPEWELKEHIEINNDQETMRRLEVVLRESDEEYFKKLATYLHFVRRPQYTAEKHREALQYLELHPIRKMLLLHLTHWIERNHTLQIIMDKDKTIQWPKINWPNSEHDFGTACTGTSAPSATQVLTDISEIKEKLAACRAVGVVKLHPLDEQEQIAARAPLLKQKPLSEKQHHTLVTRTINEINRFYYEQMDQGRFSGETTFLITCEQTRLDSDIALLGERVREYFDNIFDPEYPRKKFHIYTAINSLTSGGLAVVLKWGLHADRANHAEKFPARSIQHIGIEQIIQP